MTHLGLGVMLGILKGNKESVETFQENIGKIIKNLEIADNELRFTFEDNTGMRLFDNGQSCCEVRYMYTDDKLSDFIGAALLGAEIREGPTEEIWGEPKESQFLIVSTSNGQFTVVNYNEHNGYYGGFLVVAALYSPPLDENEQELI
jgi:hypothetical protein